MHELLQLVEVGVTLLLGVLVDRGSHRQLGVEDANVVAGGVPVGKPQAVSLVDCQSLHGTHLTLQNLRNFFLNCSLLSSKQPFSIDSTKGYRISNSSSSMMEMVSAVIFRMLLFPNSLQVSLSMQSTSIEAMISWDLFRSSDTTSPILSTDFEGCNSTDLFMKSYTRDFTETLFFRLGSWGLKSSQLLLLKSRFLWYPMKSSLSFLFAISSSSLSIRGLYVVRYLGTGFSWGRKVHSFIISNFTNLFRTQLWILDLRCWLYKSCTRLGLYLFFLNSSFFLSISSSFICLFWWQDCESHETFLQSLLMGWLCSFWYTFGEGCFKDLLFSMLFRRPQLIL